jgi:hypothetical protein
LAEAAKVASAKAIIINSLRAIERSFLRPHFDQASRTFANRLPAMA